MKRALITGINNYPGTRNDLNGCVNDAKEWKGLLINKYGYNEIRTLFNDNVTIKNVTNNMIDVVKSSKDGDKLAITYSGHGSKARDRNGDEPDKIDETWYLYDGHLLDDTIRSIISKLNKNVRLTIISDSCHSGTVSRAFLSTMSDETYYAKPRYMPPEDEIEAITMGAPVARKFLQENDMNHILITGAKSTEYSYDAYFDKPMGAMSYYAINILKKTPNITYEQFYKQLRKQLPSGKYKQTPQLEGRQEYKNRIMFS